MSKGKEEEIWKSKKRRGTESVSRCELSDDSHIVDAGNGHPSGVAYSANYSVLQVLEDHLTLSSSISQHYQQTLCMPPAYPSPSIRSRSLSVL